MWVVTRRVQVLVQVMAEKVTVLEGPLRVVAGTTHVWVVVSM